MHIFAIIWVLKLNNMFILVMVLILMVSWWFLLLVNIVMVVIPEEPWSLVIVHVEKLAMTVNFFNRNHKKLIEFESAFSN